jgi:hypothetical protein
MYYIKNKNGEVIGKCNYEPDIKDLQKRGETFTFSDTPLEIVVKNSPENEQIVSEYKKVYSKMFKMAQKLLQDEGEEFVFLKDYHKKA